jgi:hypothetical protein
MKWNTRLGESTMKPVTSTGNKSWSGMDVALYQELCGSRQKQRVESRGAGGKRLMSWRDNVCWLYSDGICMHTPCKFPHLCELCQGNHPKRYCSKRGGADSTKGGTCSLKAVIWSEVHVSLFGVIPKSEPGKWYLIVDLSSPCGNSVNDGINKEWLQTRPIMFSKCTHIYSHFLLHKFTL